MSDHAAGPGWWMASDGRWYPPELHPDAQSRPSPPPLSPPAPIAPDPASWAPVAPAPWWGAPAESPPPGPGQPTHGQPRPGRPAPGESGFTPPASTAIGAAGRGPASGATSSSRRRSTIGLAAVGVVVVAAIVVLAVVLPGAGASSGAKPPKRTTPTTAPLAHETSVPLTRTASGWTMTSLHVVGGPTSADGLALVLTVANKTLEEDAIDPATAKLVWRVPFSPSTITPGVAFSPVATGGVTVVLLPSAGLSNPYVTVEGIDVRTGVVRWKLPAAVDVNDAPDTCDAGSFFCLAVTDYSAATKLLVIRASDGTIVRSIPGIVREMGQGLYQTDASTPTFEAVDAQGQPMWTRSVASIFGGPQWSPDGGWDFLVHDGTLVGSVGPVVTPATKTISLASFTVGIDPQTGAVRWRDPGSFDCGGSIPLDDTPVICQYTGSLTAPAKDGEPPIFNNVTLALEGLDVATGAITWRHPVADVEAVSLGEFASPDDAHIVIEPSAAHTDVLDLRSGAVTPATSSMRFWCENMPPAYAVHAPGQGTVRGQPYGANRAGVQTAYGCAGAGTPSPSLPATGTDAVGVTIDGLFVWPAKRGLQAAKLTGA